MRNNKINTYDFNFLDKNNYYEHNKIPIINENIENNSNFNLLVNNFDKDNPCIKELLEYAKIKNKFIFETKKNDFLINKFNNLKNENNKFKNNSIEKEKKLKTEKKFNKFTQLNNTIINLNKTIKKNNIYEISIPSDLNEFKINKKNFSFSKKKLKNNKNKDFKKIYEKINLPNEKYNLNILKLDENNKYLNLNNKIQKIKSKNKFENNLNILLKQKLINWTSNNNYSKNTHELNNIIENYKKINNFDINDNIFKIKKEDNIESIKLKIKIENLIKIIYKLENIIYN